MKNNKLSVRFVIAKSRLRKDGKAPLYCRLIYLEKRIQFATGMFVEPENWMSKMQIVKLPNPEHNHINLQLSLIRQNVNQAFLMLQIKDSDFDINDVVKQYNGDTPKEEKGTSEFYQEYLIEFKKLVGKEIKLATWNKFYYIGNHLKKFIKWKFKTKDIPLKQLNIKFLDDFDFYLKTQENQEQITINKTIQRLRKVVKSAMAEEYIASNPFILFKAKTVKHKVVYLSPEELKSIEEYKFDTVTLERIRDCFVFCCYTGLAYLEMRNLKKENLVKGFDGKLWIQMDREKTTKPLSIPLLDKALNVIEKYKSHQSEYVLPKMSNQKFNKYLKDIVKEVKIKKRLTHHTARKTFATTVLLYNDVPMEIVSELLGHSSITITQAHYGKIVQAKVSEKMISLNKKFKN